MQRPEIVRGKIPEPPGPDASRYERLNTLRDRRDRPILWPDVSRETPLGFLERCGYMRHELEGGSGPEHKRFFGELFRENPDIRRVAEIGFNAGVSSSIFLDLHPNITVQSWDIMWHHYSMYAKLYVDYRYPGRHLLVAGDSAQSLPTWIEQHILPHKEDNHPFDLIFIDGDHSYERARADIINMSYLADSKTVVVIDNVAPHRGCSEQVYRAYRDLWSEGLLCHERHVEIGDYHDGLVVCRYRTDPSRGASRELARADPDWKHIERRVRTTQATREMGLCRTRDELEKKYQEAKGYEQEDGPDSYIDREYSRLRDRFINREKFKRVLCPRG